MTCPHPTCSVEIPPAVFACREHREATPRRLVRALRRARALRLRTGDSRVQEVVLLLILRAWRGHDVESELNRIVGMNR